MVFQKDEIGEIYNIGSGSEKMNIEIANLILEELNKPKTLIEFVKDRPGHDFRYSLDIARTTGLGWKPSYQFKDALSKTIRWYVDNEWWWRPLIGLT